jgi:hypothetical protein
VKAIRLLRLQRVSDGEWNLLLVGSKFPSGNNAFSLALAPSLFYEYPTRTPCLLFTTTYTVPRDIISSCTLMEGDLHRGALGLSGRSTRGATLQTTVLWVVAGAGVG